MEETHRVRHAERRWSFHGHESDSMTTTMTLAQHPTCYQPRLDRPLLLLSLYEGFITQAGLITSRTSVIDSTSRSFPLPEVMGVSLKVPALSSLASLVPQATSPHPEVGFRSHLIHMTKDCLTTQEILSFQEPCVVIGIKTKYKFLLINHILTAPQLYRASLQLVP